MQKRLLIIEDDAGLQNFFQKVLGHAGYDLTIIENREEIEATINSMDFDLILCDLELDGDNIIDFVAYSVEQSLPLIVISANDQYVRDCLELGVQAFVLKPILAKDLLSLVSGIYELENTKIYLPPDLL